MRLRFSEPETSSNAAAPERARPRDLTAHDIELFMTGLSIAESLMAERVEERLQDLEHLVIKQAERIEDLEAQLNAVLRLAQRAASRSRPSKNEAA